MRVKRYVVDSMPDALQRIRTELGKDAVILNTKEVKSGGFLGFFSKKRIEVIAATDNTFNSPRPVSPSNVTSRAADSENSPKTNMARPSEFQAVGLLEHESAEETNPKKETQKDVIISSDKTKDDALIEEVRQVKELFLRYSVKEGISYIPAAFQNIRSRLLDQDIDPMIVETMIAKGLADHPADQWNEQEAARIIRASLLELLRCGEHKSLSAVTKIAHFVGPTGVGKTTTIAKLAAEQVLKQNRKVGFITSDTYRIAAIEQLKTYATILNVPLEVVFSPQELAKTFNILADRDIIFMDTAGRNYRNEMYVSELNTLLKDNGGSETYLVLSLTSKYRDMKTITENFSKFKLDKVLFTKMDETDTFGSIVNLAHDFSLRNSYITNGQNVPDDIEQLNEERIIDLIMGGIGHE